jgi:hypothetical protein
MRQGCKIELLGRGKLYETFVLVNDPIEIVCNRTNLSSQTII